MYEEELERFSVETEHRDHYTLSLIQEYRIVSTMSGGRQRIAGLRRYDVRGGGHANYIDERTFKIVATGEIARRVGP
jgi:hypothetical protein